ncbi:glycosyl hydrolase family 47-domain-containing protein [Lineolata rhizophorae]|uniref:alpha-1,2-Mannosidase n=1 Tax=Lineolata rhizophorae TaxID=578093 RepID=A0A6A6P6T3_9PEZI|nr:glycosyl hydrolase family 47-domain-containing protein [Lineolata rhizophorae]
MLRYRRYRVFVVLAVLTILALYQFGGSYSTNWQQAASSLSHLHDSDADADAKPPAAADQQQPEQQAPPALDKIEIPEAEGHVEPTATPPPVPPGDVPPQRIPPPLPSARPSPPALGDTSDGPAEPLDPVAAEVPAPAPPMAEAGEGRVEVDRPPTTLPVIHWERPTEHFPVESTVPLPTATPRRDIPRIQHDFAGQRAASAADDEIRLQRLAAVKDAFEHAWGGYREKAWMADEISPVSGGQRNPFAGWGATLVDSLDSLWMMGLVEEFDHAVEEGVAKIDFTTSIRGDIPLFETTIRYLGGLLGAYDISGGRHRVLLDKAVELAEIVMGAFDTPNRMPITYYYWKPAFTSQPHRASTGVVLAELGSLSIEFTRLAQLTKEPKYYDAIARITDALEEWQMDTRIPGLWPTKLDASGCQKHMNQIVSQSPRDATEELLGANATMLDADVTSPQQPHGWEKRQMDDLPKAGAQANANGNSGAQPATNNIPTPPDALGQPGSAQEQGNRQPNCIPQGLGHVSQTASEAYSIGGMADSTYEYLPKQWLLLGGALSQYRTMYEASAEAAIEHLVYRPMLPPPEESGPGSREWDILFAGSKHVKGPASRSDGSSSSSYSPNGDRFEAEGAHLTCFAGAMFALGAKLYPDTRGAAGDMDAARRLTDGCVWAYNITATAIMPESFHVVPCESADPAAPCPWDEDLYKRYLDPNAEQRWRAYEQQLDRERERDEMASLRALTRSSPAPAPAATPAPLAPADDAEPAGPPRFPQATPPAAAAPRLPPTVPDGLQVQKPLTRDEFVEAKVRDERIPRGLTAIGGRKYILRPEAIESVFYMYRVSGDPYWREAGWDMFSAVQRHTRTEWANSAIDDVTKEAPQLLDEMESFWLAETLKYFYLLFADEDLVSLDDYVLNTEAHPFKRPDMVA